LLSYVAIVTLRARLFGLQESITPTISTNCKTQMS
jgi:hypothetical protein